MANEVECEPADIDERYPQHLRRDTKKAVEEIYTKGVLSYCLPQDPLANNYVKRIFGEGHYTIIDNVERLPEQLPVLFASLTSQGFAGARILSCRVRTVN